MNLLMILVTSAALAFSPILVITGQVSAQSKDPSQQQTVSSQVPTNSAPNMSIVDGEEKTPDLADDLADSQGSPGLAGVINTRVESKEFVITTPGPSFAIASCGPSEERTGGGYKLLQNWERFTIGGSYPVNEKDWRLDYSSTLVGNRGTVFAICSTNPP